MPESTMPSFDPAHLGPPRFLVCSQCSTRIAHSSQIVSRAFRGHAGKAALFTTAKNVILDPPSILLMDSGAYTISEYICRTCETYLGWKFVRALDGPERWKEGHFILELDLVDEEDDAGDERYMEGQSSPLSRIDEEPHPRMPTHKRTQSGTVHPPPKAAREGLRSLQAGPKKTAASRRRNLDDDDDDYDGKPFWKPR